MCIFHVLTVRGLPGNEGASSPCMGFPGNAEALLATRLVNIIVCVMGVQLAVSFVFPSSLALDGHS